MLFGHLVSCTLEVKRLFPVILFPVSRLEVTLEVKGFDRLSLLGPWILFPRAPRARIRRASGRARARARRVSRPRSPKRAEVALGRKGERWLSRMTSGGLSLSKGVGSTGFSLVPFACPKGRVWLLWPDTLQRAKVDPLSA